MFTWIGFDFSDSSLGKGGPLIRSCGFNCFPAGKHHY